MPPNVVPDALAGAYRTLAMGHGQQHLAQAHTALQEAAKADPAVLLELKQELARAESVSNRCFVSKTTAQFLRSVITRIEASEQ